MTGSLTDDDLGARLRSALQSVSPLATDPVPPPRFAPSAATVASSIDRGDVVELGGAKVVGPAGARSRRRLVLAGGLLAAAAVAAGVLVATTDVGGDTTAATIAPGRTDTVPTVAATPPTGPGDGWFAYPELVRCEARTGAILSAAHVTTPDHLDVWTVSAAATCRAMPLEHGRYLFDPPRARNAEDTPAHIEGSSACLMASTRATTGSTSFVSYGNGDYLEFFGPSCLIRSASR